MKILVTGGAGFIGSHVVDMLIGQGHNVTIVDNLSSGKMDNVNVKANFHEVDISDSYKIREIFKKHEPEIVYHLAAQIDVRKSVEDPIADAKINVLATLNLLELAREFNVKHFIFSSTGGVMYGDNKEIPTDEEQKQDPISPYGCAKLTIEKYLYFYDKVYGLKYTSLRYSNVYGPRQNPEGEAGVIAIFFNKMSSKKHPDIFGGIQTRDFVYVEDVARANILALKDSQSAIYNVSTGKETDIIEIFSKINNYFDNKFKPTYHEIKKGEQKRSCLDCSRIKANLGWKPLVDIDEGLDKTYCWYLRDKK